MLCFALRSTVGGLAVLLVLQPLLGVSPVMACLIEVAYEGGHGSAAAMGPSYAALGFPGGQALGLAMATVGLLSSTLVGGLVVVVAMMMCRFTCVQSASCVPPARSLQLQVRARSREMDKFLVKY